MDGARQPAGDQHVAESDDDGAKVFTIHKEAGAPIGLDLADVPMGGVEVARVKSGLLHGRVEKGARLLSFNGETFSSAKAASCACVDAGGECTLVILPAAEVVRPRTPSTPATVLARFKSISLLPSPARSFKDSDVLLRS